MPAIMLCDTFGSACTILKTIVSASVLQVYPATATCGDVDGSGSGTAAYNCRTGYVAKTGASNVSLASFNYPTEVKDACCVAQVWGVGPTYFSAATSQDICKVVCAVTDIRA